MTAEDIAAFAFRAQTAAGDAVTGTINAGSVAEASRQLHALQLRAIELDPIRAEPRRSKPLTGDDFRPSTCNWRILPPPVCRWKRAFG